MPPAKTHKCFATDCREQVPVRMLMCLTHWRLVPAEQQQDVYRTNRLRSRGGRFEAEHRNACIAARESVRVAQAAQSPMQRDTA